MRTAAIELADAIGTLSRQPTAVDAIFVTSLMSAADLRALLPGAFRNIPIMLYMHENQMAYPSGEGGADSRDAHFMFTNLTSAATADLVIFNSDWNRRSFFEGAQELLGHARDAHLGHLLPAIDAKSSVIWPPVELPPETPASSRAQQPATTVVWPHRWEHDKGPEELLNIARRYSHEVNLRWIILGERFENVPQALETFQHEFTDRIEHCGFVACREDYWRWLQQADWVLSTARHEFFGIAVVEAMMAGALPWLPSRLSYPELLPAVARKLSPMNPPANVQQIQRALRAQLDRATASNAVSQLDAVIEQGVRTIADDVTRRPHPVSTGHKPEETV